jgi:hypothetical protein
MKLSEMTMDQSCDCLIRLTDPVANILNDENIGEIFKQYSDPETQKEPVYKMIAMLLPKVATFAVKNHKKDFYEIIGALTLKPASAVGKMSLKDVLTVLKESIDEELISFFRSSGSVTNATGD